MPRSAAYPTYEAYLDAVEVWAQEDDRRAIWVTWVRRERFLLAENERWWSKRKWWFGGLALATVGGAIYTLAIARKS